MRFFHQFILAGLLVTSSATTLPLRRRSNNATAPMVSTLYGTVFDVETTIGGQTFQLLVDSGSSDLYVMKTGFTCLDQESGQTLTEEECRYDLNRTYDVSDRYQEIPNQIFGIEYGAGIASGVMAYEEVTIAGITVPKQQVAIADKSTPMGDGVSSGLIGLGYPALTSAHPSNITDNSTYWYHRLQYKPLLFNMYEQGLIEEPYFAHVLARAPLNDSSPAFGGYLSFGELPPVRHEDVWAIAPVDILETIPLNYTSYKRSRSYWATTLSASLGSHNTSLGTNSSSSISAPFQVFFDSGNPLSYIPLRIADPLNQLFSPPGIYNSDLQAYIVDCDAKAPSTFSLEIGGYMFTHDARDLIYQTGEDLCISAIGNSDDIELLREFELNIIGVPFLKGVMSVFDIGRGEMRFTKLTEEVGRQGWESDGGAGEGDKGNDELYIPENDAGATRAVFGIGVLSILGLVSTLVTGLSM
ncbi:pepsin-like aspartic protease [Aspergillus undulatus]|uniref:pepsin-like aspartic protease n=1 Tax=Aspergillus undulatus TaxID=1810928 RepID=UPI003CCCDDD6